MRKFLSLMIALTLLCGLALPAVAVNVEVSTDVAVIEAGDTVTVTLVLDETVTTNYNVTTVQCTLSYDWDILTYASATAGDGYASWLVITSSSKKAEIKINSGVNFNVKELPAGTICTVTFTANETVTAQDLELIVALKTANSNGVTVNDLSDSVSVTVCPGHTYEASVTTPGTCVSNAVITYTCTYCGDSYTEEGEPDTGNHVNLDHYESQAPTCTETGLNEFWYCPDCDCFFADEACTRITNYLSQVIPATGHSYGDGVITTPGTCVTPAVVTYTCTVCGDSYTGEGECDTGNHEDVQHQNGFAPTCTETGLNEFWYCNACGGMWSDEACAQVTSYTSQIIPATGHTDGEAVVENKTEGSCTETGTYELATYCTVCGEETGRTAVEYYAGGSTLVAVVSLEEAVSSTSAFQGELGYDETCLIPVSVFTNDAYASLTTVISTKSSVVKFNWYDFSGTADFAAGEVVTVTFSVLQDITREELASMLDLNILAGDGTAVAGSVETSPYHTLDEGVYTAPTCTTDGYWTYTCVDCKENVVRAEAGSALGHTPGEETIENVVAPSSSQIGSYDVVVRCTVCGDVVSSEHIETYMIGDVNQDRSVDIMDAMKVVGYYNETAELTGYQLDAADVNGDGQINIFDANLIVALYNEDIEKFPVEQ